MRALLDSRCLAALVSIATIPWALASMWFGETLERLYAGLDSELGGLSQLLLTPGATNVAAILAVVGALATLVRLGPERAAPETVRALQVAVLVTLAGSAIALQAILGPIETLFDKIA